MARKPRTPQAPLTEQDLEYAKMLLDYSKYIGEKGPVTLELYEEIYWVRGRDSLAL